MTQHNPVFSDRFPSQVRVNRPRRAVPADAVRPTRAEVNLAALRHNLRVMKRAAGGAQVWSVLKADAYGHGAKAVARTLERAGVDGICVALLEEGIELRDAGIQKPILVMGGCYGRALSDLFAYGLTPVIHDFDQLDAVAEEVRYSGAPPLGVHIKVDTGMSRLGTRVEDMEQLASALVERPELRLEGLMTHLATADSGDSGLLSVQLNAFQRAEKALTQRGIHVPLRHAANTAAILRAPNACFDIVRPGIGIFGVEPVEGICAELKPVMTIRSEIVALRELTRGTSVGYGATWTAEKASRIATLPMGYADGLTRSASNKGAVLIRGKRAPIVGVVSMDMTMVDVTDIEGARLGDECVILGQQSGPLGTDSIGARELASLAGTIPWEVLTNVSRRVPRFYREP